MTAPDKNFPSVAPTEDLDGRMTAQVNGEGFDWRSLQEVKRKMLEQVPAISS